MSIWQLAYPSPPILQLQPYLCSKLLTKYSKNVHWKHTKRFWTKLYTLGIRYKSGLFHICSKFSWIETHKSTNNLLQVLTKIFKPLSVINGFLSVVFYQCILLTQSAYLLFIVITLFVFSLFYWKLNIRTWKMLIWNYSQKT